MFQICHNAADHHLQRILNGDAPAHDVFRPKQLAGKRLADDHVVLRHQRVVGIALEEGEGEDVEEGAVGEHQIGV